MGAENNKKSTHSAPTTRIVEVDGVRLGGSEDGDGESDDGLEEEHDEEEGR